MSRGTKGVYRVFGRRSSRQMSFQLYHLVQLDQPTQMRQLINAFRTPLTNVNDRVGPEGTKGSRMVIRLHPSK